MKNIIKIFFVVLLALSFASCTEKGPDATNGNKLNEQLKLTVDVIKVEGLTATVRITSDGSDEDTWYGFVTDETDVMKAYQNKILELTSSGAITGLKNSPSFMTQAVNLEPYTDYNYIVFGINKKGEIYGAPVAAKFTSGLIETDRWEVSYNGKDVAGKGESAKEYEHTIRVKSKENDDQKYFVACFEKEYLDAIIAYYGGIEPLAESYLEYLKAVIKEVNNQNAGTEKQTIESILFPDVVGGIVQDGIEAASIYPTDWCAVAIGVDHKHITSTGAGRLSGEYSITHFNIPEETATKEYSSWIGKWTWTGANGVSWDVEFHKYINNLWYTMTGWEGFGEKSNLNIIVDWNKEKERWEIYSANLGTFQFADGIGDGFVSANYTITQNNKEPVEASLTDEGILICYLDTAEDGSFICKGYSGTAEGTTAEMKYLHYLAVFDDYIRYMTNPKDGWPTFPITITPYSESSDDDDEFGPLPSAASIEKEKEGVQIFTRLPETKGFKFDPKL